MSSNFQEKQKDSFLFLLQLHKTSARERKSYEKRKLFLQILGMVLQKLKEAETARPGRMIAIYRGVIRVLEKLGITRLDFCCDIILCLLAVKFSNLMQTWRVYLKDRFIPSWLSFFRRLRCFHIKN